MKTLIRGATVVLPDETVNTSVLIEGSKIAAIDPAVHSAADETIDADGMHLIPGVIDDQVHFREPGLTHKEDLHAASRACAKGGVTSFLEMPNTNPATTSVAALHAKLELASTKAVVNYAFFIGATPENLAELKQAQRTPGISRSSSGRGSAATAFGVARLPSTIEAQKCWVSARCHVSSATVQSGQVGTGTDASERPPSADLMAATARWNRSDSVAVDSTKSIMGQTLDSQPTDLFIFG